MADRDVMAEPEGATPLDPDEREGLCYPHVETRQELNTLEQQNILQGLKWLAIQRKYRDYLSEDFVCELHRQLFGKVWRWAGQFRKTEKNIGIDPLNISVQLRLLLDDARYWAEHGTCHREEVAAHFHHRLVSIHLFPNGNGRHARVMTDVILERVLHQPAVEWGAGLLDDNAHRQRYLAALRAADQRNYAPLMQFITGFGNNSAK
jgi:Fic-DOC domain mobile mystery protein B